MRPFLLFHSCNFSLPAIPQKNVVVPCETAKNGGFFIGIKSENGAIEGVLSYLKKLSSTALLFLCWFGGAYLWATVAMQSILWASYGALLLFFLTMKLVIYQLGPWLFVDVPVFEWNFYRYPKNAATEDIDENKVDGKKEI